MYSSSRNWTITTTWTELFLKWFAFKVLEKEISETIFILYFIVTFFFGNCLECPQGLYGRNCLNKCSENCYMYKACDIKTGVCPQGCVVGWKPPLCNEGTCILFTSISPVYNFPFTVFLVYRSYWCYTYFPKILICFNWQNLPIYPSNSIFNYPTGLKNIH